jgi:hypothetical protein
MGQVIPFAAPVLKRPTGVDALLPAHTIAGYEWDMLRSLSPDLAFFYAEQAAEAKAKADLMTDGGIREAMLQLASVWERMAVLELTTEALRAAEQDLLKVPSHRKGAGRKGAGHSALLRSKNCCFSD